MFGVRLPYDPRYSLALDLVIEVLQFISDERFPATIQGSFPSLVLYRKEV